MKILIHNLLENHSKLLEFGFSKVNNELVFKKDLKNNLFTLFTINNDFLSINIDVFDYNTEEKFEPFYLKKLSTYAEQITQEVDNLLLQILDNCFIKNNVKNILIEYCESTFKSVIERPWQKHPDFITLKALENKKWYALFMNVAFKKLDKTSFLNDKVDILNIKLEPLKIIQLIDSKTFFKAYHMNSKHWVTILLNKSVDLKLIKQLISESYSNIIKSK